MVNYTNSNRPTEDTPLLERVRWAIGSAEVESFDTLEWTEEAQAAIRVVAEWLREQFPKSDFYAVELENAAELDNFPKAP
jgi:hypothetical protein